MPRHLARPSRRSRFVATMAIVAAATLLGAAVLWTSLALSPLYVMKPLVLCAAIGLVALGHFEQHHPFSVVGSANQVTAFRAGLVALVAALIGEAPSQTTAWCAALLGVASTTLDGVDGWLARRSGMTSDFGARFDMEVDALLILVLAVLAWQHDKAGAWIVLAGAMRYLFVAAGYLWHWMNAPLPPSGRRKAVCVVQIVGLGIVVSPFATAPVSAVLAAITLAALTWSFGVDVLWLRRHGV